MRKHDVYSRIDSGIPAGYIQNEINIYTVSFIKKTLCKSGLPKEVQIEIIDDLIEYIKTNNTNS